jgi:N-acyl homoserine lactone hydrolase
MRCDDVRRIDLGTFVRPAEETGTGQPRVEAVYGYLFRSSAGLLLLDTGLGEADEETDAWCRPRASLFQTPCGRSGLPWRTSRSWSTAICTSTTLGVIRSSPGGRSSASGVSSTPPAVLSTRCPSLWTSRGSATNCWTAVRDLPRVHVIPTPGHVDGHQSVLVKCDDGSIVLAGQAHDTASEWSADSLAERAAALGHGPPLPNPSPWMRRIREFDPKGVVFAHDSAVWLP